MIPPTQVYLDLLQAKARARLKTEGQAAFRRRCKRIAAELRKRGTSAVPDTSGRRKSHSAFLVTNRTPSVGRAARLPV